MKDKIEEAKKKTWFEKMLDEQKGTPLFEAEGKILELEEDNYKLNKKIGSLEIALDITTGTLEGSQAVVKELEAKLQVAEDKVKLHDRTQYEMVNKQFLKQLNERIEELESRVESLQSEVEHSYYKGRREEE